MGAQPENSDPQLGNFYAGGSGNGGGAGAGDGGAPQLRLIVQHPFTFTREDVEVIEAELLRVSEITNTECTFVASRECVRILGNAREDLEQGRTEITNLLRLIGKDKFRTRALKLPEKKAVKKSKEEKPKDEALLKLPADSDEEERKFSEEPQRREMSLFSLDRRIRNLSAIVNNYGPEHLPPIVPGAVDKLRDIQKETGVEAEVDKNDPRLITVSGRDFEAVQDAVSRLECLQKAYLDPPPTDLEPEVVVYHSDHNLSFRLGLQHMAESRKEPFGPPLPRALANVFDIVIAPHEIEGRGGRRCPAESAPEANPKSYSAVAKTNVKVASPGDQRCSHNVAVAAKSLRRGLEYARLWRGEVRLEAKIGIVVVNGATNRDIHKTVSFDKLQSLFEKNPKLHFNDIATANRKVTEQLILTLSKPPNSADTAPTCVTSGRSYAAVGRGDPPADVEPADPVPTVPPTPRIRSRRETRFVITCKGRADIIHPWTFAKITLDAGTLKPLSIVPLSSTPLTDVYWRHLDNRWDWRLRLKGWHREGRLDVKPFITFLKKLTFSPQGGGLSYEDQPELFEVLRLKHKVTVYIPLDEESKNECAITRVVVLRLPRDASEEEKDDTEDEIDSVDVSGGRQAANEKVSVQTNAKQFRVRRIDDPESEDEHDEAHEGGAAASSEADVELDRDGIPRQHYTIKVQSKRWRELFAENCTMGMGRKASWTADEVLNRSPTGSISSMPNQSHSRSSFQPSWSASSFASSSSSSIASLSSSFANFSINGSDQLATSTSSWDTLTSAEANPLFNRLFVNRSASSLTNAELASFVESVTKVVNLLPSVCGT